MKFPVTNKYRLAVDPTGAQVTLKYGDKFLIGDVKGVYQDFNTGSTKLRVNHFNGEPWPIDPVFNMVEVLERREA